MWRVHRKPAKRDRTRGRKRTRDGIVRDTARYGDEDTNVWIDRAERSDVGKKKKREQLQETEMKARCRETQSAEETFAQRLKLCPTGGKTLIKRSKKLFR